MTASLHFWLAATEEVGGMLIAEFRIKIIGDLKKKESIQLDPHLDDMAKAIEKKVELIFKSKLPANLKGKVSLRFEE
jgi:hypothetical protein